MKQTKKGFRCRIDSNGKVRLSQRARQHAELRIERKIKAEMRPLLCGVFGHGDVINCNYQIVVSRHNPRAGAKYTWITFDDH